MKVLISEIQEQKLHLFEDQVQEAEKGAGKKELMFPWCNWFHSGYNPKITLLMME